MTPVLRHALRRRLRRGHHVDLDAREDLGERERHVTGPRRHVDEKKVGLIPPRLRDQLLNRFVQHGAPPDNGLLVGDEVTHRQTAHTVNQSRNHGVAQNNGIVRSAQHLGERESVDVRVEYPDFVSRLRQGDGEIDRHRRLTHTALAR